jgi:branched-chain amino acid transport system substrate-binding protein
VVHAQPGLSPNPSKPRRRMLAGVAGTAAATLLLAACSSTTNTPASPSASASATGPIKIGVSVSLSGDFSSDGQATQQGYELWSAYQNAHGGILGRQIQMVFLSDGSSPTQVATNYEKLITVDHVDFVLGPYSTKLTKPASVIAARYGYVMLEGIGGGPSVFQRGLKNVFDVSASAAFQMITLAKWIGDTQTPQPIAYATMDDPFIKPMVDSSVAYLSAKGFTTAVYKIYPAEQTDFSPIASSLAATKAKIAILGTMPPDGNAFIQSFVQDKYNPAIFAEASGPDQGSAFTKAVGAKNTEGIMVPNTWYPGSSFFENKDMIAAYIAKFGGDANSISSDVPEVFSAGQVLTQAVTHLGKIDNKALQDYLHSGAMFQSVQGPVQFAADGQNQAATPYMFQWQKGQYLPVLPIGAGADIVPMVNPRPNWGTTPGK